MSKNSIFPRSALAEFENRYDPTREETALNARGKFLKAFPIGRINRLTVDQYVIGYKKPTFCAFVEAKTSSWARIQGATAYKFGIYFGRDKSHPRDAYRFTRKYGKTKKTAFKSVKSELQALIKEGKKKSPNFLAIDSNKLSQMFKAKILSLYFQNRFVSVCSGDHLVLLAERLKIPSKKPLSEIQHLLLRAKQSDPKTRRWSNPKFMMFLYETYIWTTTNFAKVIKAPRKKSHPEINMEDIQDRKNARGKAAEKYALAWEKERLRGAGLAHLISKIGDRRKQPSYGYDFLSHSDTRRQRFIEVKSVGTTAKSSPFKFFLSENERKVSKSRDHERGYYFYLVFFNHKGKPYHLESLRCTDVYPAALISPASYVVRFVVNRLNKD
jgi:Domain of unknown function (DUF3883)